MDKQPVPTDKQIYETGQTNPTVAAAMLRQKQRNQKAQSKGQTGARPEPKPSR